MICRFDVVAVAAAALIAAGCNPTVEPEGPCPRASVLADAVEFTRFREGPGRDVIDIEYEGDIAEVRLDCDYDDDRIEADVEIIGSVRRGPAAPTRNPRLELFLAIVGPTGEVLAKDNFPITVNFPGNSRRQSFTYEIENAFVRPAEGRDGGDYEFLVGYQLTRAQLEYNRSRRGF